MCLIAGCMQLSFLASGKMNIFLHNSIFISIFEALEARKSSQESTGVELTLIN